MNMMAELTDTEEMPLANGELLNNVVIEGIRSCRYGQNPSESESEGEDDRKVPQKLNSLDGVVFPDIAVQQILKDADSDQQTLLNCRLVCVQWNEIIKNTSALMRRITFIIADESFKEFLGLAIYNSGLVKSIKFMDPSPAWCLIPEQLQSFTDLIQNVEIVEFAFHSRKSGSTCLKLLQLILGNCVNIEELVLTSDFRGEYYRNRNDNDNGNSGLLGDITATTEIAACSKINYISVNLAKFARGQSDIAGLKRLLLKLPRLKEIKFYGWFCVLTHFEMILTSLFEYISQFSKALDLKKLSLGIPIYCWYGFQPMLIKLLILCVVHQIEIDVELSTINLNRFLATDLDLSDILDTTIKCRRPFLPIKFDAELCFREDEALMSLDKLQILNISRLQFTFRRDIIAGELNWVGSLQCLESLRLTRTTRRHLKKLASNSVRELEESFSAGLPSLNVLDISIEIFEWTHINCWPDYFPHLNELYIRDCYNLPDNLISQLTVLESLSHLYLDNLKTLSDTAFTADCLNGFLTNEVNKGPPHLAPISCFKSLKPISLCSLPLLSDACVINGISKCTTLDKLEIRFCRNITEQCCEIIKCEVKFEEALLSDNEDEDEQYEDSEDDN